MEEIMQRILSIQMLILLGSLTACALLGCGGGGTPSVSVQPAADRHAAGSATFTMKWPAPTRLIPAAANSIVVQILQGAVSLGKQTLARPTTGSTTSVTFNGLPTGTLSVTATAYPNADGTGVAQATATTSIAIQANQNTAFNLTMASTIAQLQLSAPQTSLAIGFSVQLGVAAMDASGATVLLTPSKLQWLSSNTAAATVDANGKVQGVAAGSSDLSVTDTESGKSAKVTLTVRAPGSVAFQISQMFNVTTPNHVVTADFDGDGKMDFAVGTPTALLVFWGNGDGTFTGPQTILTGTSFVKPYSAADMNGDGKPDITCTTTNSQWVVIPNLGGRQFAAPIAVPLAAGLGPLVTGDFDGDGKPDVAVISVDSIGNNYINVYKNNGDGTFTPVTTVGAPGIVLGMTAADLNGDGKLDLILSRTADVVGESGANIYWGDGAGHFSSGPNINTATENTNDTCVGNFFGDGRLSFAIGNYTDSTVSVVHNLGGGAFATPATYHAAGAPEHLVTADVNGDGAPDIVVGNSPYNYITVMPNKGGLFPDLVTIPLPTPAGPIAVADFNSDGKPDVVVCSLNGNKMVILLNTSQ
jgi:hypothetical protein